MKLISNHLLLSDTFKQLKDITVRINIAHVRDKNELIKFISTDKDIMIDYPLGRKKLPIPTLTINEVIKTIKDKKNIKFFAISNVESALEVLSMKEMLSPNIQIVPKIETVNGVVNLRDILKFGKVEYIMLDSEDLFTDCKNNNFLYLNLKNEVEIACKENNVNLFKMYGVVFSDD